VALVYDVLDTEGEPLPKDVASFFAVGAIDEQNMKAFIRLMNKKGIELTWIDAGDRSAGEISVVKRTVKEKEARGYKILINRNHAPAVQFASLVHELGHLFLGHLGPDNALNIPQRPRMDHAQDELEAESVSFLVCARNGVTSEAETYLKDYVKGHTTVEQIDLYQVMRAAGQVETLLGLVAQTKYDRPLKRGY